MLRDKFRNVISNANSEVKYREKRRKQTNMRRKENRYINIIPHKITTT